MRCKFFLWLLCGLFLVNYSCSDEASLSVDYAGESISLGAEAGSDYTLSFSASEDWTATADADWLDVSPGSGTAGDTRLTLTVTRPNDTGKARSAQVRLSAGGASREITVRQDEYIRVENASLTLPAEGGVFEVFFCTTLPGGEFSVFTQADCDWLTSPPDTRAASRETEWRLTMNALPNETSHSRTTTIYFGKVSSQNQTLTTGNLLATVTLVQEGQMSGESTDYSQDGVVSLLQEHSAGQGIPLVLMGDGFIDREIANGYYAQVMDRAVENIFSEEPIRSLKDYFDIYAVTAVSQVNLFNEDRNTALKCWLEGGSSTLIKGDNEAVQAYVQKIEGINPDDAQAVVLLNTNAYAGTNYNYWMNIGNEALDFAIAYCPVIGDLESEDFRRVLTHEAVGHGIGKLQDEYSYEEEGAMPADEIEEIQQQQRDFGWWQNVDFTDNPQQVLWTGFLYDPRYEGQGLGIFEGACSYWTGAYRPTEDSMMRNNTPGFNAPSRRAIYNQVIRRGEGRTPELEEFIGFDQQTYVPQTRAAAAPSRPFARPRVVMLERPLGK